MNKNKVSSKDVAKLAGVSQATVSYVLNNVQGIKIKPETREAVLNAAKKLNYHPNMIARNMRLKRSMSVGIVTDKNISNTMFSKVLEGIKDELVTRNYSITHCLSRSQELENAEFIKYYNSNLIDGVIFAFANVTDEQLAYMVENNIPFVIIHTNWKGEAVNVVRTDPYNAIVEATGYLQEKGTDSILYLGSITGGNRDRRFNSFSRAMEHMGLEIKEENLIRIPSGDPDPESYIRTSLQEIAGRNYLKPPAIICESTHLAFHLLRCAADMKISIPDKLRVIAIGTSNFSSMSYPSLSAIESPLYEMGYTGAKMLFDLMKGESVQNVVVLEYTFVKRESV